MTQFYDTNNLQLGKFSHHQGKARDAGTISAVYTRFTHLNGRIVEMYIGQSLYGHAGRWSGVDHKTSVRIPKDAEVDVLFFASTGVVNGELKLLEMAVASRIALGFYGELLTTRAVETLSQNFSREVRTFVSILADQYVELIYKHIAKVNGDKGVFSAEEHSIS